MTTGLPPELNALKNTIRQIVTDECQTLEPDYLANPPQEGIEQEGCLLYTSPSPRDRG